MGCSSRCGTSAIPVVVHPCIQARTHAHTDTHGPTTRCAGQVPGSQVTGALAQDVTINVAQVTGLSQAPIPAANLQGSLSNAYISPDRVCTTGQQPTNIGSCVLVCVFCLFSARARAPTPARVSVRLRAVRCQENGVVRPFAADRSGGGCY